MIASSGFLSLIVTIALGMAVLTPIILISLFIRDWKRGEQW